MVFAPLVSTLFVLGLTAIVQTTSIHGNSVHHRGLSQRVAHPVELIERHPVSRKINRRRSCNAPGISSSISTAVAPSSTINVATTKQEVAETTTTLEKTSTSTTEKHTAPTTTATTAATTTAASTETGTTSSGSSSSSSSGGHQFTLINKCSNAVKPVVVTTACGYSPRCSDASTAAMPSIGSLAAGGTTTINIANNFVGRIFAQDGSCGAKGEDCTMLEFNLDADSFYTPNSYDISNIQGFTQSISLGAAGCSTVTCTSPSCTCENAYPIGDMTGCGNDLPVKACSKGNKAFTVVFCP
ncbi:hypothetical protein DFH09DRAFT_1187210 [Mycena vulgaris]|nr:hypothetical protein DFH09DRAFT_1187210 [Mycena vulgaris]